jgi:hypothetical protein
MKNITHCGGYWLLLLLLVLAAPVARAQAPAWQMALPITGVSIEATTTDANGDLYLAGYCVGSFTLGGSTITSAGAADIFVAKWSPTTNSFVWARRAGGTGIDEAYAIAVENGNVYITGDFSGPTADFGSTTLPNAGIYDVFVAKLTDTGASTSFTWAQRGGGSRADMGKGIAVNGGNVYITGIFNSAPATFGSLSLTSIGNSYDAFIVKLTDAGASSSFTWAQQAGGSSLDEAAAIAVSGNKVYVTGWYNQVAIFGGTTLYNASTAAFVTKLTDAGPSSSFEWVKSSDANAGVQSGVQANALVVNGNDIYIAGYHAAAVRFGNITLTGGIDVFVAKLTDVGSDADFIWALSSGGSSGSRGTALAVSGNNVYVAGTSSASATFGNTTLTNNNMFVAKLADAGSSASFTWAQGAGGDRNDFAKAVAVSGSRVYMSGVLLSLTASFGSLTMPTSGGFLAALGDPIPTATSPTRSSLGLSLYPNPSHGTTLVQLPAIAGATQATLALHDALGRVLSSQVLALPTAGLHHELSLAGLAPGVYALRVQAGAATAVRRLVVE